MGRESPLKWVGVGFAVVVIVVQLAPAIVLVAASFSASAAFDLPWTGVSLRWYRRLLGVSGFWSSVELSANIAVVSTAVSLVLGTSCAIGLFKGRFPGRNAVIAALLSPLMLPGLVFGMAMLHGYRLYSLRNSYASLLVAHVVITAPYIVRVMLAGLSLFNFEMVDAARTLGYSRYGALMRIAPPNLYPPLLISGLFAFLASFNNYSISIFLADARNRTLPIQMLEFVDEFADPTLAAMSALLVALACAALGLGYVIVNAEALVAASRYRTFAAAADGILPSRRTAGAGDQSSG
jgi:putative spermidine/putrescine transport system permease protein